jgi:2-deoxy-D-gluconate 3-dehydrogenase
MRLNMTSFDLNGKTALVTGASRGIGRAIALGLAKAGADVIVIASTQENAMGTLAEIKALGRRSSAIGCDQSRATDVKEACEAIFRLYEKIDILVNNAGTIRRAPSEDYTDEDWQSVIDTNLTGVFQFCREIGKDMFKRGSGKIINIASLLSFQGGLTVPAYAASKGGVAQLTKALANEWASGGVQVNAIAPGYIATDNTAALRSDPIRNKEIMARIPAKRWGKPEDIVGAALFLSSSSADYVNGHVLTVDGGWMGR